MKKALEKTNSPITGIITLALFAGVAIASQHQKPSDFIAQKVAAYDSSKTLTYAQTKERHIAINQLKAWQMTDAEITAPVDLLDEKGNKQ